MFHIGKAFGPVMTLCSVLVPWALAPACWTLVLSELLNPVRGILFLFDGKLNAAGLYGLRYALSLCSGAGSFGPDMGHAQ